LVKRRHRVIAERDRAENLMKYRRHESGHVLSRLDFLTVQDVDHARWLAEIAPFASMNWKDRQIGRTSGQYITEDCITGSLSGRA
jgi:hypothetical protein